MTLTTIIDTITGLAQAVVPVLVSLAFLFFLWGLASFLLSAGDPEKQKVGKDRMIWGGVALFFIVSVGGLLAILSQTFFPSNVHSVPPGYNANQFPSSFPSSGNTGIDGLHDIPQNGNANTFSGGNNTLSGGTQDSDSTGFGARFRSFGCFFGVGDCARNDPDREGFPRLRGTVE